MNQPAATGSHHSLGIRDRQRQELRVTLNSLDRREKILGVNCVLFLALQVGLTCQPGTL
jgi:hypothetical protein